MAYKHKHDDNFPYSRVYLAILILTPILAIYIPEVGARIIAGVAMAGIVLFIWSLRCGSSVGKQ